MERERLEKLKQKAEKEKAGKDKEVDGKVFTDLKSMPSFFSDLKLIIVCKQMTIFIIFCSIILVSVIYLCWS